MLRSVSIVLLLLVLPACEALVGQEGSRYTEATPLTEPWTALALPIDGGKVTVSDGATVSVHHAKGTTEELGNAYGAALAAGGWARGADTSAAGVVNQTWTKDGKTLALTVLDRAGERIVSLSILPF